MPPAGMIFRLERCGMKFAHIADLHIGKRVHDFSMLEDQRYILDQMMKIFEEQKVDGVLIAGDVYDKTVPSAEAVQLFDEFITGLAKAEIPVYMISGNHDSAERLSFGAKLFESSDIYISQVYDGEMKRIVLEDQYGPISVYLLPFLKPAAVRHALQRDDIKVNSKVYAKLSEQYAEVMKEIQTERMITGHWDKFIGRGKPSPNRGKISITDGVSNRYVDVDFKIPDGWYRGSTQHREHLNHSEMMKNAWQRNRDNRVGKNHPMYGKGDLLKGEKNGRYGVKLIYMNNGIKNKMVKPEEVSMYTAKGFVKGMIKKR